MVDANKLRTLRSSLYKDAHKNPMKILTTPTAAINGYIRHQARIKDVKITGTSSLRKMMIREARIKLDILRTKANNKFHNFMRSRPDSINYPQHRIDTIWESMCGHLYLNEPPYVHVESNSTSKNPMAGKYYRAIANGEWVEITKKEFNQSNIQNRRVGFENEETETKEAPQAFPMELD